MTHGFVPLRVGVKAPPAPSPTDEDDAYKLHRRFDRLGRLVGDDGMRRLFATHAMVVGQGGVGSWAAEALVRSGIGRVTIVDFDLVCVTNANRQLHAMRGTTGRAKVGVMAERLRTINPACEVVELQQFYDASTSEALLERVPDVVVDAIDNIKAKAHLIATCSTRRIPIVVSGGASGRLDPTQIREFDLASAGDPMLAATRKVLRSKYGFPRTKPWNMPAVVSLEPIQMPMPLAYDGDAGFRCVCPQGENGMHECERRRVIYGTAGFVTGSIGFACAAAAIRISMHADDPAHAPTLRTSVTSAALNDAEAAEQTDD